MFVVIIFGKQELVYYSEVKIQHRIFPELIYGGADM